MNKWVIIIGTLLILGIIGGIVGYKYVYNKPHRNYETAVADYSVSCEELFTSYNSSVSEAETKYNGKVLEINGVLSEIEAVDSLTIVVFSLQEGMFGDEGIRCTLLSNYKKAAENLVVGKRVTIKGYCTGYNDTDVILEKCSII